MKNTIKQELKRQKITQKQLAKYLGIGKEYLSSLMTGRYSFTEKMLIDIAMFLGIPKENLGVYDIQDLIEENKQLKEELKELKTTIKHLINAIGE